MMRALLTVTLTTGFFFGLAGLRVAESSAAEGVDQDNDGKGTPIPIKCINPQRHQQVMQNLAEQSKQGAIVPMFGGSFVQGWERGKNRASWDKFLAPLDAVNCGIGGEASWGTLWRLRNGAIDGYRAKAVVLFSTGANDVANEDSTAQTIINGVKACVREVQQRQPEAPIVLVPIPDVQEMVAVIKPRKAAEGRYKVYADVNRAMAAMADGKQIFFLSGFDAGLKARAADLAEEMKQIMKGSKDPHDTKIMYEVAVDTLPKALEDILAKRLPVRATSSLPEAK